MGRCWWILFAMAEQALTSVGHAATIITHQHYHGHHHHHDHNHQHEHHHYHGHHHQHGLRVDHQHDEHCAHSSECSASSSDADTQRHLDERDDRHELTRSSYEKHASEAIQHWSTAPFLAMPWLLTEAITAFQRRNAYRPRFALDLGCAVGSDARSLARPPHCCSVVGVDIVQEFLDRAQAMAASDSSLVGTVRFERCDLVRLGDVAHSWLAQQGAPFDLVWSNSVLMHMNPSEFANLLGVLTTVMHPGSILAAAIPAATEELVAGEGSSAGMLAEGFIPGRYIRSYGTAEVVRLLQTATPPRWSVLYCKPSSRTTETRAGVLTHVIAILN